MGLDGCKRDARMAGVADHGDAGFLTRLLKESMGGGSEGLECGAVRKSEGLNGAPYAERREERKSEFRTLSICRERSFHGRLAKKVFEGAPHCAPKAFFAGIEICLQREDPVALFACLSILAQDGPEIGDDVLFGILHRRFSPAAGRGAGARMRWRRWR